MPDPYEPASGQMLDDMLVATRDFARMAYGQFESFIEVGFTEVQSMKLMAAWVTAHIGAGRDA